MPPAGTLVELPELNLLREWRDPVTPGRIGRALGGSLVVHFLIVVVWFTLPEVVRTPEAAAIVKPDFHQAVKLVVPRNFEPTQKAPNIGKVKRELDIHSA